jgi:2-oxoglutarate dehydrogenase E2 component (dihydrolipoamide succinyltransferase)
MPANIVVPELGESVVEATVARWLKKEGEPVSVGEALVELETEKVDLEVGATQEGVLARIERGDGEHVKIGDVLGVIEDGEAARPAAEAPPEAEAGEPVATPSARRLAREHEIDLAEVRGTGEGGRVTRDDVQSYLKGQETGAAAAPPPVEAAEKAPPPAAPAGAERRQGPRPVPRDAAADLARQEPRETPVEAGFRDTSVGVGLKPAPTPAATEDRREERVRMSRRRLTIARRLVEAQRTAAMLTTFNEIDMTAVMELRRRRKESFKTRYGVGLGLTSFFVKASIAALRRFPRLNAEIQGEEMVLKHYYDIGVAVGAAQGLVVPVLRDADRMSFAEIEQGIKEFARKAEDGSLTLEDLRGGTFTITNGGVFGSLLSTPILNPPQVGILGLHKVEDRAVPLNGQVTVRPRMYVALSYDHRIVDGMEAVQFLVQVKELVEDPAGLLLEG